ncbi:glycerophosphoryl diester phosphodiesterase [Nautilia profundicola AmH]|uniref:Glycerophosphoryl diester phosphodiesterase n=1 Tax=Nautilia profundicola (strain ATCC BAA-1463 / DSM 18972 / AmH) TaxID=598659 RepID=B9L7I3_NAUPA|nr:glycerophosphodiester phosphodiesterase family protein [Nautilia profundicola]ACM93198.1 glycerophosphoryl diester phosphodiesterase [Nautilia profundicola AmH]
MFKAFEKEHICIAHRGLRAFYPENTMPAFEKSLNRFDMFEFDVHYTKDLKPVVIHDGDLRELTDVSDRFDRYCVGELTLDEIKTLDNVSKFIKNNPFNKELNIQELSDMNKNSIPHLDEVLAFIKQHSFPANLEIKDSDIDEDYIIKDLRERIEKFGVKDLVLISSYNHGYIKKLQKYHTAALFDYEMKDLKAYLKDLNVCAYHIDIDNFNKKTVSELLKENIYTNVYTVNDKKKILDLFKMGVKGVFCDYFS